GRNQERRLTAAPRCPEFLSHGNLSTGQVQGPSMIMASELREGMTLRIEDQIYKVLEVASKVGAAKMGGVVKTKLFNVRSGRIWEPHFRPQERLQDLEIERRLMQFLYVEGDICTFMRPDTFEQVEIP
ncbi:MAG TPA: hypothetical protein VFV92_03755, partial [Candidatus Bathyarchaeia archaeon]|nr:hypothetical protein [Candidatus Bathyarchaeia archaeon]